MAVGVLGGRDHRLGVVELLPERRQQVAPVAAVVQRPGDRALVVADPAVVRAGQQVGRLGGIVDDVVLGVAPEGAVLVDPDVAVGIAVAAAERPAGDADVALAGLGGDRAVGGEQPVVGRAHAAPVVDLLGRLEQAAGEERRPFGADLRPSFITGSARLEPTPDRVLQGLGLGPAGRTARAEGDQGRQDDHHAQGGDDALAQGALLALGATCSAAQPSEPAGGRRPVR